MSPLAVEAHDLFRVHSTPEGDAAALQGLTLDVGEGELLTVLGPSGAGKTSFLRILAGLDVPSAGTIRVFGRNLRALGRGERARYRTEVVGYLDQHYDRALAPELTAVELVGLRLRADGGEWRPRAEELLARVGLGSKLRSRPAELSGGEQQRVALCAALAHRPRLLLADEPTGELDEVGARLVYDAIAGLASAEGCTVVVVSHDPASTSVADRFVHIRDGRVSEETVGGEDAIVVGRGGWLRLPQEFLERAGIGTRASASLEGGRIVVSAAGSDGAVPEEPELRLAAAGPGAPVGVLRGVVKTHGHGATAARVFAGLDAFFPAGRLTAVTGPSGSGKTTLLHLLAGLDLPDAGEVLVDGTAVNALDRPARAELRRRAIALVPQQSGLVPFLSARENVELGQSIRGLDGDAQDALTAVGLGERAGQRVSRLSAGEQVRVAVARAVAARPRLLLVDEPTARLDQANALRLAALLVALARDTGTAVVCATHDPVVIEQADDELALAAEPVAVG
ncbi:MAG TPA: ATP-binding cassette domain-containing protein [Gaiellaceae bacterium]|nr:ATP-binding cassette domain-containing protein [Gaiellaceae bacterium]